MANTHKQRIRDLKGDDTSAQPSSNGQGIRSRKIKPNTNSSQTKDNESSFANIESEFHHGGKQAKGLRAKVFASWILKVFFDIVPTSTDKDNSISSQQDRLICQPCQNNNIASSTQSEQQSQQSVHVFDIAGGKGQLSLQLILQQMHCPSTSSRISRCTIVDPMVRKSDAKQRHAKLKKAVSHLRKNSNDIDGDAPTIEHMATCFTKDTFPEIYSNSISIGNADEVSSPSHTNSLLLGLHPDEPTEDILDAALEHNLSVAIIPCCVYADLFPSRMIKRSSSDDEGKHVEVPVRNYSDFLQYLLDKDESLKLATLPFEGKNKVIYRKV